MARTEWPVDDSFSIADARRDAYKIEINPCNASIHPFAQNSFRSINFEPAIQEDSKVGHVDFRLSLEIVKFHSFWICGKNLIMSFWH